MAEHLLVKPEKLILTAVGMLEQELVVPRLFARQGIDQFKGALNDTINFTVEGVLPFHTYAWRNDRSSPIVFDEYAERKISMSFGGNFYSAVKLTDEQYDFDLTGWAKLLRPQTQAVSRGLQRKAVDTLTAQEFPVTIGNCKTNLRGALIEARRVLKAFNVPAGGWYLLCGSNFEAALLNEEKLVMAQYVGDLTAGSALHEAAIGHLMGFNIIVDQTIPSDTAYALVPSAFAFLSGTPAVPSSVPFGATASFENIALRWVRDYDPLYMQDRSVVNTYAGFQAVTDVLVGWDNVNDKEFVSTGEYFVRGVRLTLDGDSDYPTINTELANITGINSENAWTPTGTEVEPALSLAVTPATASVVAGETKALAASVTYGTEDPVVVTKRVAWTTSDETKATVNANGVVTAVAAGTANITATYAGKTATCAVTVTSS